MSIVVDGRIAYTLDEIKDAFYDTFAGSGTCYFYGSTRPEQAEYVEPHWNEFVYFLERQGDDPRHTTRLVEHSTEATECSGTKPRGGGNRD